MNAARSSFLVKAIIRVLFTRGQFAPCRRLAPWGLVLVTAALMATLGCRSLLVDRTAAAGPQLQNPLFVPATDREFVFDQTLDAVERYFKIESQRRIQAVGGVLTPGRIDTFPVIGATLLEPWRADFDMSRETTYNTLQTLRRYAMVELIPVEGGFIVSVNVFRELEDLSQPELSTVGSNTRRFDGTLVTGSQQLVEGPVTLGWIPLGRDIGLEQKILAEIQARMVDCP